LAVFEPDSPGLRGARGQAVGGTAHWISNALIAGAIPVIDTHSKTPPRILRVHDAAAIHRGIFLRAENTGRCA
jgi:hypothetical protein